MSNEWEIARGSGRCAVTGRELAEGETYYAALIETPSGFERRDYSVEGWSGPPAEAFCCFKTRVPARDRKPTLIAVDTGVLLALFGRLEEDASDMRQKFRFVLALLLMRKRLLRFEGAIREDGREYWRMRLVSDNQVHRVLNPDLSPREIDSLSGQLTAILSGDAQAIGALEEPAAVEPSPSEGPEAQAAAPLAEESPPTAPAGDSPCP